MSDFDHKVGSLDLALFEKIESQSTEDDKRSLLAIQSAVRERDPEYVYLEIGSYLGGSIQPFLLDDRCKEIISIDKRPTKQPDARGFDYTYLNNSTERMMENLRSVSGEGIAKIIAIDGSTADIDPARIERPVKLCFIDGEHTDTAVVRDFEFCRRVLDPKGGAIVFHDSQITYNGIAQCVKQLEDDGVDFRAYNLPHILFVIEFGDLPIHAHPSIFERLVNNHRGYLFSLQDNDKFRRFATKYPFRAVRNMIARVKRGNVSQ